jgi:hypothetical protein
VYHVKQFRFGSDCNVRRFSEVGYFDDAKIRSGKYFPEFRYLGSADHLIFTLTLLLSGKYFPQEQKGSGDFG